MLPLLPLILSLLLGTTKGSWPVPELRTPETLHIARVADLGLPHDYSPSACGQNMTADCHRGMRLLTALLSYAGTQLRQSSTQGLFLIDEDPYTTTGKAKQDSVEWLERLLRVRPKLSVVKHSNGTVWDVIGAMNRADAGKTLRYVKYTYDAPGGSPQSLNAARMAASRLNATMVDATLVAEAEHAGFVPAEATTADGVRWGADVSSMNDARVLREWVPAMTPSTVGMEQFTLGHLYAYQADVAGAFKLLSWSPDGWGGNQTAFLQNREQFLCSLTNDSLVFGLSHTSQDEDDLVRDTSVASKILTVSEGSFNVALLSSFRTSAPSLVQKPFAMPEAPPTKHYVAFMLHDGDGIDFELGGEAPGMMSGFWDKAVRSTVPIGWGISGQFRDLAQPVVESLYADASRNGTRGYDDFFMQDGYGYASPSLFTADTRETDAIRTGRAARELNLSTVAFFGIDKDGWDNVERDLAPYAQHGHYSALQFWRQDDGTSSQCYISNDPSERGALKWVGDTPVMQLRASLWFTPRWPGQCLNTSEVAKLLNAQIVDPASSRGYSLVHVQGDTPECKDLACLTELASKLAPHVQVVGPSVLTKLARRYVTKPTEAVAAFRCEDALSCELNGRCDPSGTCQCGPGWTGPTCGTLDLLPARRGGAWPREHPTPPEYWGDGRTPAGWGGSIQRSDDAKYHLFSATGCYIPARIMHMDGWELNHAVAQDPEGPYDFVETVISASAFNPKTARLPDGRFLLYHVGASSLPSSSGYNATCTGNETRPAAPAATAAALGGDGKCHVEDCFNQRCQPQSGNPDSACVDAGCVLDPGFGECYPPAWNTSSSIHVMISEAAVLDGRWAQSGTVKIVGTHNVPSIALASVDNPSPLVLPNSSSPSGYTLLLAYRYPGNDSWCGAPRCAPSVIGLAKAEHWAGPYVAQGKLQWPAVGAILPYLGPDAGSLGCEDPVLFRGANGSLHMLVHKYDDGAAPGWPGLHGFSADGGRTWHVSKEVDGRGAYSFEVEWQQQHPPAGTGTSSTITRFARRERPELHVDPETFAPLLLSTGVQLQPSGEGGNTHQYSFTLVQRAAGG